MLLRSRRLIIWHIYILVTKCQRYLCKILCKDRRREIDAGPDGVNFPAGFIAEGPEWVWHHQFCQKRGKMRTKRKFRKKLVGWLMQIFKGEKEREDYKKSRRRKRHWLSLILQQDLLLKDSCGCYITSFVRKGNMKNDNRKMW